jgi:quercetin dioxygenase-like cupin family protein
MNQYDWNSLPAEQLNTQITRRAVHTQNLTIARLEIQKDAVVPEHHHVQEQVATV